MSRTLIGLSVASGLEGVDAVAVRVEGLGLDLTPRTVPAGRTVFPPAVRDVIRAATNSPATLPPEFLRAVADTVVFAARQAMSKAAVSPRDTFAVGFLEPRVAVGKPVQHRHAGLPTATGPPAGPATRSRPRPTFSSSATPPKRGCSFTSGRSRRCC